MKKIKNLLGYIFINTGGLFAVIGVVKVCWSWGLRLMSKLW